MIVIGDIAGQHDSLMKLVDKLPPLKPILLLGDLNDRGWESKQVIQWAMANEQRVTTIDSNHGDIFTDWFFQQVAESYKPRYDHEIFEYNGGRSTMSSYGINISRCDKEELLANDILVKHIAWLKSRPSHIIKEIAGQRYLFSHAPMNPNTHRDFAQFLLKGENADDPDMIGGHLWNRNEPFAFHRDLPATISVFGHNSGLDIKLFCEQYENGIYVKGPDKLKELFDINKDQVYGICMDTSRGEKITALDLETLDLWHSNYPPSAGSMY